MLAVVTAVQDVVDGPWILNAQSLRGMTNGQNRTDDPRFTKALLYRLSYVGTWPETCRRPPEPALARGCVSEPKQA
jgi:hypothetical protein